MEQLKPIIPALLDLRKALHKYPELSNAEEKTAKIISDFIENKLDTDKSIKNIGGHGLAFVYEGQKDGPAIAFRCELDALPIAEKNRFDYRSESGNVSHMCGHDGHMTVLAGLAAVLSKHRPGKGKVVLLFQPAEENGEGALRMIQDEQFQQLRPDLIFALHNLPGYPLHKIILKTGVFSCASRGMIVKLTGQTSHAAHPEKGRSPAQAIAEIIHSLNELPQRDEASEDFSLATLTYTRLGEMAFGTTPGKADIMVTLRAYGDEQLQSFSDSIEKIVKTIAINHKLHYEINWQDEFAASVNNEQAVDIIRSAAKSCGLEIYHRTRPFRWSEDFGHFTKEFKGALFGIGAGVNHPELHQDDYDFPDILIETSVDLLYQIVQETLG